MQTHDVSFSSMRSERHEPPPTEKGRRTEAAFREAARKVIARDGYANAKVADIAAEANRSLGSFYNYFDDKDDVLESMAQDFKREVVDRIRAVDRTDRRPQATMTLQIRA